MKNKKNILFALGLFIYGLFASAANIDLYYWPQKQGAYVSWTAGTNWMYESGGEQITTNVKEQIDAAVKVGAPYVEFHTGAYANAVTDSDRDNELKRLKEMAAYAHSLGIHVNSGHGLNYNNVAAIAAIPEMEELNIGHSIIARAIFTGLSEAVREMKRIMREARHNA